MKFTMKMPFTVVPGPRRDGHYTATVVDRRGLYIAHVDDIDGRSILSQDAANEAAVRKARAWAQRVREHAGV